MENMSLLPLSSKLFPESIIVIGNKTLVCHNPQKISSYGFMTQQNPMHYATPLLLIQLSLVSIISMLIDFLLRPLGQCSMVSQIFGGIMFGPSGLGHDMLIGPVLFPPRGRNIFETFATFGIMFFFFTVGVKMDPRMMIRPGRKSAVIGLSALFTTMAFAHFLTYVLHYFVTLSPEMAKYLFIIATAQSITSFQNVSGVLGELKMLQSDLGRLAVSTAMFCDLIFLTGTGCAVLQTASHDMAISVVAAMVFALFILVAVFIIRPLILRSARRIPEGKPVPESCISAIFTTVLVVGFVSEMIGQNFVFGPMILGLVVPEGPPIGAAITDKLDIPVGKVLYPSFLTASGLKTDMFAIQFESFCTIGLVVLLSCTVKISAIMLPAIYMGMTTRESLVLGMMLTSKGIADLVLYNLLLDSQVLNGEAFALCVMSVLVVTAILTPLIKLLYDPTQHGVALARRTIQHSKTDAEMRMLVCIHDQENVPEFLNLLVASNATDETPIAVIALLLIELVGRANPMLIAHQPHRMLQPNSSRSGRVINALRQYELHNETCVTMQSYSSLSPFDTMHEDIFRVAIDKNTVVIILPFHKRWEIDGSIGSVNRAIQGMNSKVMENAPCSVAILVDRGLLRASASMLNSQTKYHVGLVFIGGVDDAEALSYAARMARRPNISLTIYHFLLFGSQNTRERKLDNNLMEEVRHGNVGNERFVYQEEIIKDCVGLAASIRSLGSYKYDLILVGKSHEDYPLLVGFGAWVDCPELGIVGDILSGPDAECSSSVLVVQQQRFKGKIIKRSTAQVVPSLHDA
ncbi:OLC1v1025417C1 [Oldenlandia corymbosa var. corymbosa]|uniref:OLC1v1025417C1 n=1 Tax=Oldenlandia corymbosa var. corymbosa TaxID=529605 RepID=A0AAV1C5J6_OLDCO|nr:OLC1v1025417C1 [Oldenlandia corymbosa var. corymbosa]